MGDGRVTQIRFDGSSPLTREHVIGQWLPPHLHGEGLLHHAHTALGYTVPGLTWDSKRADFKAKVVCKPCNNGWMCQLEAAANVTLPSFLRTVADPGANPRVVNR